MAKKPVVNNNKEKDDLEGKQELNPSNPDDSKEKDEAQEKAEAEAREAQEKAEKERLEQIRLENELKQQELAKQKAEQERLEQERQQTEEALRREMEKQKNTITMLNPNFDAKPKEAEVHPDMVGNWELEGWKVK